MSQMTLGSRTIKDHLCFLQRSLPKQPTAVASPYVLPDHFQLRLLNRPFAQIQMERFTEHVGYYLGLMAPVSVKVTESPLDTHLPRGRSEPGAEAAGLYKVTRSSSGGEILIHRSADFSLGQVLAITVHEYTHHYLLKHGVADEDPLRNEHVTDIACAFLGLGHLMMEGYRPVVTGEWLDRATYTRKRRICHVGYLTPATLRKAVIMATPIRGWDPVEVMKGFVRPCDRILARLQLLPVSWRLAGRRRRQKRQETAVRRKEMEQEAVRTSLSDLDEMHQRLKRALASISENPPMSMPEEDGLALRDLFFESSEDRFDAEMGNLTRSLQKALADGTPTHELKQRLDGLKSKMTEWLLLLDRYI